MRSLWTETSKIQRFPELSGDHRTDVLIVGGGMAGVLTAYMLTRAGVDCMLIEADSIGSGATSGTTAKITAQHGMIYDALNRRFGVELAGMYLEANIEALGLYRDMCREISCDFRERDSYAYTLSDRRVAERDAEALSLLGADAYFTEEISLPFPVAGAVCFPRQAEFHPLKFLSAISDGLNIFENTRALAFNENTVEYERGKIKAGSIVIATHFPVINNHGAYFLKMYQHRSYTVAFENAPDVGGMYVDEAKVGLSFRNYDGLLLISGGDHRTGKRGECYNAPLDFARRYYPKAREKYRFAAQDCMTLDDIPYIGRYSGKSRNVYVATGFNKWGMTSSMVAAMILSDALTGKNNPFAPVFSPSRSIMRSQLLLNSLSAVAGIATPTVPRCPHLGCALRWNREEQTWDCPCHGSRFTGDGRWCDGPANGDLLAKQKKRHGNEKLS